MLIKHVLQNPSRLKKKIWVNRVGSGSLEAAVELKNIEKRLNLFRSID
jgi:hypothetical protein